jgi:hypothetical protein
MSTIWAFVQNKKNREILGWVGAGLAAVIDGLWTAFVYFSPPSKTSAGGPTVQASCGSVAAGGNVSGSTITAGNAGNCPEQKPEQKSEKKP